MILRHSSVSFYVISLLYLLTSAIFCEAYAYDRLEARYAIRLMGIPLGTASLSGLLNGDHYNLEATGRLTGIASLISRARAAARATGLVSKDHILPSSFATTASNSQMSRTVRMGMSNGNVRAVDIFPPFEELPGRVPVADIHKKAIVDPLSALIFPLKAKSFGPEICNRSIPIYDGWTRFNIKLSYLGETDVTSAGYNGHVFICAARYEPIAGHRPEREATKFMVNNKEMEVWLAPLSDHDVAVPFKISVATMIGTTVIEALEFQSTHENKTIKSLRKLGQNDATP
jgi:Protein of unknown function (DUF3108)